MPLLEATNRKTISSIVAVHVGIIAVEVQIASIVTVYRRTPKVTV